ncbi:peptidoglycan recognition protein family protein [Sphaerisporangium sp. NPDC004334]
MAIDLVTRAQWGARAPKGSYSTLRSTHGVKVHYTGGRVDPGVVDDHDRCVLAVRAIQRMHMDGNGWLDIGYSMVACPHRKVFVGRGPGHLPAANGPGLNSDHYAVLGLVGNAGLVQPPDGMLLGILDAIDYLRAHGGAGHEIKGHRDGYATDCPGGPLYAWVKRGAPRPGVTPSKPAPKPVDGDDNPVPEYVRELRLKMPMMRGDDVATWQRGARRFVPPLDVDGVFGADSKRAAETVQRTVGMPINGVVDAETWLLTWVWEPEPKEKK